MLWQLLRRVHFAVIFRAGTVPYSERVVADLLWTISWISVRMICSNERVVIDGKTKDGSYKSLLSSDSQKAGSKTILIHRSSKHHQRASSKKQHQTKGEDMSKGSAIAWHLVALVVPITHSPPAGNKADIGERLESLVCLIRHLLVVPERIPPNFHRDTARLLAREK